MPINVLSTCAGIPELHFLDQSISKLGYGEGVEKHSDVQSRNASSGCCSVQNGDGEPGNPVEVQTQQTYRNIKMIYLYIFANNNRIHIYWCTG